MLKKFKKDIFRYKKVCYITNWSQYRAKPAKFLPENVDPFLCTHVNKFTNLKITMAGLKS